MKKILIAFILIAVFTGCEDFLDVQPANSVSYDEALETLEDFEVALLGAYAQMRNNNGNLQQILGDVMADNAILTDINNGAFVQEHNWTYTQGEETFEDFWDDLYATIASANFIINRIETVESDDVALRNDILGQALAIRAYSHFILVIWYANDYNVDPSAAGVPIVLTNDINLPDRNTIDEVYAQIESDLEEAANLIDEQGSANAIRFSRSAVHALLTRVLLHKEDWPGVIAYSDSVLQNPEFALVSDSASFVQSWATDQSTENIFKLRVVFQDNNPRIGWAYYFVNNAGDVRQDYEVAEDLFTSYTPEDVRLPAYYDDINGYRTIIKYPGRQGSGADAQAGMNDLKLIRLPEVLLNRAEALARTGGRGADALASLNDLRTARGLAAGNETGADLLTAISLERRKELAFEGFRWHDLRRNGLPVIRNAGQCNPNTRSECVLNASNFKFVLPIPFAELNVNENIIQNEGY